MLFALGYRPELHREITNKVGVEITSIRKDGATRAERKSYNAVSGIELIEMVRAIAVANVGHGST